MCNKLVVLPKFIVEILDGLSGTLTWGLILATVEPSRCIDMNGYGRPMKPEKAC